MLANASILVFAKAPVAGQVKTRLLPDISAEQAAALHQRLLRHTLITACRNKLAPIELWCMPFPHHPLLALYQTEFGLSLHQQQGADLGQRMLHAAQDALQRADIIIIIGTDCPGLCEDDLHQALRLLSTSMDAVIGPAEDGGYWLLGLRRCDVSLFTDINWGKDTVLSETRDRLRTLNWGWQELKTRWDVDRPEDLSRLSMEYPDIIIA